MGVLRDFWTLSMFSFVVAIIAVMYYRFTKPGEVLAWWSALLRSLYYKATVSDPADMNRYIQYEWVLKPVLTCETCIAGQLSFWLTLVLFPFDVLSLLYVVGLATFMAPLLIKLLKSE